MVLVPTHQPPTHPGEMLLDEFLKPMEISPEQLAQSIRISLQELEDLLAEQQDLTPSIALRLAKFFGMSADFWLNLQMCWNLYHVQRQESTELAEIIPYQSVA